MIEPQRHWYTPDAWAWHRVTQVSPTVLRHCWERRNLWWKLDSNQARLYAKLRGNGRKRKILNCARRIGKTRLLAMDADVHAWNNGGVRDVFGAPTLKDLEDIVMEAFEEHFADCPDGLKPHWNGLKSRWDYPNGSRIRLFGCDDKRKANRGRGRAIHRAYIEEAGSNPVLRYVVHSVLAQALLSTGGEMWIASSPPDSEGHEFAEMVKAAEASGTLAHCDIWACPRYTAAQVEELIREEADLLGMTPREYRETAEYRREFLGQLITDPNLAVLPECTPERMDGSDGKAPAVVRVLPDVPMFRDRYESMDLGFHPHKVGLLFGYWDFERQVLAIEDELLEGRLNDTRLAHLLGGQKDKNGNPVPLDPPDERVGPLGMEAKLWGPHKPYIRCADNTYPMTLSELAVHHGLDFYPWPKDEREAAIVNVRRWLRQGKIAIHPRCKGLIAQVKAAVWNRHRTDFAEQPNGGHFDLLAALVGMVRNVIPNVDRVPDGYGDTWETWRSRAGKAEHPDAAALRRAFGG